MAVATHTGTAVSAGALNLSGSIAGALAVAEGATMTGAGTIDGSANVSGVLTPGSGLGTMTDNNLVFGSLLTLDVHHDCLIDTTTTGHVSLSIVPACCWR